MSSFLIRTTFITRFFFLNARTKTKKRDERKVCASSFYLMRRTVSSKKKEGAFEKNAVDLFSLPLCFLSYECALFEERQRRRRKRRDEEEKREAQK